MTCGKCCGAARSNGGAGENLSFERLFTADGRDRRTFTAVLGGG
jgi:hypothetical protein